MAVIVVVRFGYSYWSRSYSSIYHVHEETNADKDALRSIVFENASKIGSQTTIRIAGMMDNNKFGTHGTYMFIEDHEATQL